MAGEVVYPHHDMRAFWFRTRKCPQVRGTLPLLEDQTSPQFFNVKQHKGHRNMCDNYNATHPMTYLGHRTWIMNARQAAWNEELLVAHNITFTLCASYWGNEAKNMRRVKRLTLVDMNLVTQQGDKGYETLCIALVAFEEKVLEDDGDGGVYCRNGCHRSTQFCVAQQMARYRLPLEDAWQRMKRLRGLCELTWDRNRGPQRMSSASPRMQPCRLWPSVVSVLISVTIRQCSRPFQNSVLSDSSTEVRLHGSTAGVRGTW